MTQTTSQSHLVHILHRHPGISILILSSLVLASEADAASNIVFAGGAPGVTSYLSDGVTEVPTEGGFFFELGVFVDGFVPSAENTEEWIDHWVMMTDSQGAPDPDAKTEFTLVSSIFGDYGGYSASVEMDHNAPPFAAGTQGFLWGYDEREVAGDAEWILLTNSSDWRFPNAVTGQVPTQTWTLGTASPDEALVGTHNSSSMTMGSVTVPSPVAVPEPSGAVLCVLAGVVFCLRRHRPGRASDRD